MSNDVTYNQILCFTNTSLGCQTILRSYVEKGRLILILEDSHKLIIAWGCTSSKHSGHFQLKVKIAQVIFFSLASVILTWLNFSRLLRHSKVWVSVSNKILWLKKSNGFYFRASLRFIFARSDRLFLSSSEIFCLWYGFLPIPYYGLTPTS